MVLKKMVEYSNKLIKYLGKPPNFILLGFLLADFLHEY